MAYTKKKRQRQLKTKKVNLKKKRLNEVCLSKKTDIKNALKKFTVLNFKQFVIEQKPKRKISKQRLLVLEESHVKKRRRSSTFLAKTKVNAVKLSATKPHIIKTDLFDFINKTNTSGHYESYFKFFDKKVLCWNIYKDYIQKTKLQDDTYNRFREFFIDFHVTQLLIGSLGKFYNNYRIYKNISNQEYTNKVGKPTVSNKNKYILLFESNGSGSKIDIFFEMVGSQSITSDYDVSIWSNPVHPFIVDFSILFNNSFLAELNRSSGVIFDTNIYTHPIYIFNVPKSKKGYFLKIDETRYMINPGRLEFFNNEKVFANFLFLKGTKKQSGGGNHNYYKNIFKIKEATEARNTGNYKLTSSEIVNNIDGFIQIFLNPDIKMLPLIKSLCMNNGVSLKSKDCNKIKIIDQYKENTIRKEVEFIIFEYLTNELNTSNPSWLKNFNNKYIGPMRAALALADETYNTFSSYFHVIHLMATPGRSINAIDYLLKNPEDLKNMCVVSAIENFAFMFHYCELSYEQFIKKSAKYLARLSHACFLRKELDSESKRMKEKLLNGANIGCSNSIIKKFKNNMLVEEDQLIKEQSVFYNIFKHSMKKSNLKILKEIYIELIRDYGISDIDLIIYI